MPSFDEDGSSSKDPGGTGSTGPFAIADVTGLQAELDNKISGSTINAKGDLLLGTANDTVGRLAVGTNGQVLTADSTESTGAKWVNPSATDSTKIAKAGDTGISGDLLTSSAIRIGPGTSDGSDNSALTLGHSGYTRGGGIVFHGNEHANLGRVDVQPGYVGTNCLFRVLGFNGGAVLTVDGYGGQVTATYGFTGAGLTATAAVQLTGTQSSPGSGTTCLYRGSSGEFIANCGGGGWFSINVNNNQQHVFDAISGYQLPTAQSGLSSTNYGLWRDAQSTCIQSGGGCMVNSAKLVSRANSTAYALCPAPTGDVIRCLLQDSSSKRAVALLDASGTITFEAGSHADYVASSSPASGEVGVYIVSPGASGSLTIKPGSAGARSIAANVARARA